MVELGRDLWRSSSTTPLLKWGHQIKNNFKTKEVTTLGGVGTGSLWLGAFPNS